jgi:hypothetical protein
VSPKAIAAIEALSEDLPGFIDNLSDALADWQDEDLSPAEKREQREQAEETIEAAIHDLLATANAMAGWLK